MEFQGGQGRAKRKVRNIREKTNGRGNLYQVLLTFLLVLPWMDAWMD